MRRNFRCDQGSNQRSRGKVSKHNFLLPSVLRVELVQCSRSFYHSAFEAAVCYNILVMVQTVGAMGILSIAVASSETVVSTVKAIDAFETLRVRSALLRTNLVLLESVW